MRFININNTLVVMEPFIPRTITLTLSEIFHFITSLLNLWKNVSIWKGK